MLGLVALIVPANFAIAQAAPTSLPKLPANLAAVRTALDKYQDPIVAIRDGYFSTLGCIDFPTGVPRVRG